MQIKVFNLPNLLQAKQTSTGVAEWIFKEFVDKSFFFHDLTHSPEYSRLSCEELAIGRWVKVLHLKNIDSIFEGKVEGGSELVCHFQGSAYRFCVKL